MNIIRVVENPPLPRSMTARDMKGESAKKLAALMRIQAAEEAAEKNRPHARARPRWDNAIGDFRD
jgi:hypothetical protein